MWRRVCSSGLHRLGALDRLTLQPLHRLSVSRAAPSLVHSRHLNGFPGDKDVAQPTIPTDALVVICGGGVIGCSIAYHLMKMGWSDVVVIEQGSIGCGTTWHAAGLVTRHKMTALDSTICAYSAKLYAALDAEGYGTGWKQCGSLNLARSKDRVIAYRRALLSSQRIPVEGEFLRPQEIKHRFPYLATDDLQGGFWIPGDGVANPTDVTMALAKKAREGGVRFYEKTQLMKVLVDDLRVCGVETNHGTIQCQYFINCAGQWARDIGQLSKPAVRVPLHSCEHQYIITKAMDAVDSTMPVVRDYDGGVYLREWSGGVLAGGFEPKAKPVFHHRIPEQFEFQLIPEDWDHFLVRDYDGGVYVREWSGGYMAGGFEPKAKPIFHDKIPDNFENQVLPEDWDHFQVLLEQMLIRLPSLEHAEIRQLVNGPESFTPDGKPILGESPEIDNYYVAAGLNSTGIQMAGGVGKYMAEWIIHGEPSINFWSHDVRRFVDMHNNKKFLRARVTETLGFSQNIQFWDTEVAGMVTGRKLRVSPLYTRMEQTATFGQNMGYERPLYFNKSDGGMTYRPSLHRDRTLYEFSETEIPSVFGSFGKPEWFENVKAEYWACREGVCVIDMSTFSKFELRSAGDEVMKFLQYMCSNDIDKPVGMVIHTGMQNHNGGYENDCSVVRLAHNHYFMISPTAQQTRSFAWLTHHLPKDGSVQLTDVTSMYTALNVLGPRAQDLLSELTDTGLSKQEFYSMTCKEIDVGQASGVKAMRLTHSGEDGWMLYIPSEYALHVYDSIMHYGKNFGVRNAGYYALRALRTEKFFAYWGTDLTPYTTPMECGREYRVKYDPDSQVMVGAFIGDEALLRQRRTGIKKKLVQFLLDEHDLHNDPWPWGGEPIYRNGVFAGMTTSTAYGFTLDRHVCLGYVENIDAGTGEHLNVNTDFILKNAHFEIDIAGQRFPAKAGIYPPKLASAAIELKPKMTA